jgi:hypothetical protein
MPPVLGVRSVPGDRDVPQEERDLPPMRSSAAWTRQRAGMLLRLRRLLLIMVCRLIHTSLAGPGSSRVLTRGNTTPTPARPRSMATYREIVGKERR